MLVKNATTGGIYLPAFEPGTSHMQDWCFDYLLSWVHSLLRFEKVTVASNIHCIGPNVLFFVHTTIIFQFPFCSRATVFSYWQEMTAFPE
jgi:hypothetical protein